MKPILALLILATALLVAFLTSSLARHYHFAFIIGFLILSLIVFLITKAWKDTITIAVILAAFAISKLLFPQTDAVMLTVRIAAITSFVFLHLVLLIGPWSRFSSRVRTFYAHRRHLGVITFYLAALHVALIFPVYFSSSVKSTFSLLFTFYGVTALYVLLWMALTSWDYVQKKFSTAHWSILHTTLLLLYGALLYYFTTQQALSPVHLFFFGAFIVYWIFVAPYSAIRYILKTPVFGWKQLHVLVYIAYVSMILHVYFGILPTISRTIKILFWILPAIVILSHLAGWIYKLAEDQKIRNNTLHETLTKNGVLYHGIAYAKDFMDGVGKKFYINKKPIAVFKYNGTFIAVSDACGHQKGPIHQGCIVNGYIECPWHQWQYSVKNGKAPAGFHDSIPYYDTIEKNGVVYVAAQSV